MAAVLAFRPKAEHLARALAPHADLIVESMAARGTSFAGIALFPEHGGEVYGLKGCRALCALYGRSMPEAPDAPGVLVLTAHVTGWVAVADLAEAL